MPSQPCFLSRSLQCPSFYIVSSFHLIMSLTILDLLHLFLSHVYAISTLLPFTFSAMSIILHRFIFSFNYVFDQISSISSNHISIPSQPCFFSPYLQCPSFHIVSSLHLIMSLIRSPSSHPITCPYHLNLAFHCPTISL